MFTGICQLHKSAAPGGIRTKRRRDVYGVKKCVHTYRYLYWTPARHDSTAYSRAHATELQGLHLFQLSKIVVLSPPGSSRLAPTLELLPGGACVVRVLYQTRLWLSTPFVWVSGEYVKPVIGSPLVQPDTRLTILRGVLHLLLCWLAKASRCPTGDAHFNFSHALPLSSFL